MRTTFASELEKIMEDRNTYHLDSQEPMKPVWPVTSIFFSLNRLKLINIEISTL